MKRLVLIVALAALLPAAPAHAATYREAPFTCSVPILDPNVTVKHGRVEHSAGSDYAKEPKNATASVDFSGAFSRDYGARATFTLPRNPDNTGVFYSNWVLLKPTNGSAFVQVELMRWKKYDYREEIGLTWALSNGLLIYRDTGVFLSNAPHHLGIAQRNGRIAFEVDGSTICTAPARALFAPSQRLYYQLGTEVAKYGDRPVGTMSDIEVKSDHDAGYKRYTPTCIYRGFGTSWEYDGNGRFHAAGVFDPTAPYLKFTGLEWNQPCVF